MLERTEEKTGSGRVQTRKAVVMDHLMDIRKAAVASYSSD